MAAPIQLVQKIGIVLLYGNDLYILYTLFRQQELLVEHILL